MEWGIWVGGLNEPLCVWAGQRRWRVGEVGQVGHFLIAPAHIEGVKSYLQGRVGRKDPLGHFHPLKRGSDLGRYPKWVFSKGPLLEGTFS